MEKRFQNCNCNYEQLREKYYKMEKEEGITEEGFISVNIYVQILKDFGMNAFKVFLQLFLSSIYFIRIISLEIKQVKKF